MTVMTNSGTRFERYWICTRCKFIGTCSASTYKAAVPSDESKCTGFDPKEGRGPGGYWYCNFVELTTRYKKDERTLSR